MNILNKIWKKKTVISNITDFINKGDIFIDCGANVGQETIPAAEKGAIVYSFEPNPHAFAELSKRVEGMDNVHLFNKGVLDKNTTLKLYLHNQSDDDEVKWSTASSLLAEKSNVRKDKFVEVEIIDLTEFIESIGKRIKVLKIDVEGVEFEILNKLIDSGIYKNIDHILAETHEEKMPELLPKLKNLKKKIAKNNISNIDLNWI